MKILALDTETTGTNPAQHSIWQIAGIVFIDGKEKERFEILMQPNPKAKIDPSAFNPSKDKTPEQIQEAIDKLSTYMPFEEGYKIFVGILSKHVNKFEKTDKFFFLAHNAGFDNDFMRGLFLQNADQYFGSWFWPDFLCTRVLAIRQLMPIRHTMENFKLMTVARQMGIEIDESRLHDAVYDVEVTWEVFKRLRLTKTELEGIHGDFVMQEAIELAYEQLDGFILMDEEDKKIDGLENIQIAIQILRKFLKPVAAAILFFLLAFNPTDIFSQVRPHKGPNQAQKYNVWIQNQHKFNDYKLNRGQRSALGLSQGFLGTGIGANRSNNKNKNQPKTAKK